MRDNKTKMLDFIFKKINASQDELSKWYNKEYFQNRLTQLELLAELIIEGTEDEDLEYVIRELKEIERVWRTREMEYSSGAQYYCRIIADAIITSCEKRLESVKALQEDYSIGKCIP